MADAQAFTRLLLEPILTDPFIPAWLPTGVGVTLSAAAICVRVSYRSGPKPRRIMLQGLKITMPHVYEYTHGSTLVVDLPDSASWVETPPISVTFPVAGLYMVEASVSVDPPSHVECFQRLFGQHAEGRGWSDGGPMNHWHAPIAVTDRVSVQQTNLSARMERLTWIMMLLTGVLLVDPLRDLVNAMIRLGWPPQKWLNVAGLMITTAAAACLAVGSFQPYSTVHVAKPGERRIEGIPESLYSKQRRQTRLMKIGYISLAAGLALQVAAQFLR